jgi:hypothetical protein
MVGRAEQRIQLCDEGSAGHGAAPVAVAFRARVARRLGRIRSERGALSVRL